MLAHRGFSMRLLIRPSRAGTPAGAAAGGAKASPEPRSSVRRCDPVQPPPLPARNPQRQTVSVTENDAPQQPKRRLHPDEAGDRDIRRHSQPCSLQSRALCDQHGRRPTPARRDEVGRRRRYCARTRASRTTLTDPAARARRLVCAAQRFRRSSRFLCFQRRQPSLARSSAPAATRRRTGVRPGRQLTENPRPVPR